MGQQVSTSLVGSNIGLHTGARIGEVAQLKVKDIVDDGGVWCFSIRKTMDDDLRGSSGAHSRQRLKGKSAVRKLPIAQALLDAGFLEFVEEASDTDPL